MPLRLIDRKALWVPSGDLGGVGNGSHMWLNTSNGLTSDTTNVPTAAIHTFNLSGADAVQIVVGTKLTAVTGDRPCTANSSRVGLWGIPEGVDDIDALSNVPGLRAATAVAHASHRPYTLTAYVENPVIGSYQSTSFIADNIAPIIMIPDSSAPVAGDYMLSSFWAGHRTENNVSIITTATSVSHQFPRVSGMAKLKLAIKFIPSLVGGTANITAISMTGGMYALLYQEISDVEEVSALKTTPGYLKANIAAV